jgi:hypothetical protein
MCRGFGFPLIIFTIYFKIKNYIYYVFFKKFILYMVWTIFKIYFVTFFVSFKIKNIDL